MECVWSFSRLDGRQVDVCNLAQLVHGYVYLGLRCLPTLPYLGTLGKVGTYSAGIYSRWPARACWSDRGMVSVDGTH